MTQIAGSTSDSDSGGGPTPTDQVLFSRHLLEACLMGRSW
uniref:Uncharacterized protein n=1 Tax=Zea mays TaxID=4577 RepID=C4J7S9_MAIZE|nr:unknown [Zea mays]